MSFLSKLFGAKKQPESPEATNMIRVYAESGAQIMLTREQWRTGVPPGMLASNRHKPDELYTIVAGSLQDGFFEDVLEPAEHLYRTDPQRQRSVCVYSIALMKSGRHDDAEWVLRSYLEEHGEDGYVLTNLAKIYDERKETEKAEKTLWRALEVDPNQENGLNWYASICYKREGKSGQAEGWRRVAAIPGSWRAQLWLARIALERRKPDQAFLYYRESLARVGDNAPPDYLMQLSGDLGQHGYFAESLQLVEPLFVPERHGLQVGNNLIKANVELRRFDQADKIVRQLRFLKMHDWTSYLDYWDAELTKLRAKT